jgi:hypothetical protein
VISQFQKKKKRRTLLLFCVSVHACGLTGGTHLEFRIQKYRHQPTTQYGQASVMGRSFALLSLLSLPAAALQFGPIDPLWEYHFQDYHTRDWMTKQPYAKMKVGGLRSLLPRC